MKYEPLESYSRLYNPKKNPPTKRPGLKARVEALETKFNKHL